METVTMAPLRTEGDKMSIDSETATERVRYAREVAVHNLVEIGFRPQNPTDISEFIDALIILEHYILSGDLK